MKNQYVVMKYLKIQYRMAGSIILPFGITGVIIGAVEGYGN